MALRFLTFLILLFGCACSAPANDAAVENGKAVAFKPDVEDKEDLRTAASNSGKPVSRRYADWNSYYPSSAGYGYGVTGYGQDSRYNSYYGNGYDNSYGSYGGGYGGSGYAGGYGSGGYGAGYGSTGYDGYSSRGGGYGLAGNGGANGGYGGWGGNAGLSSYYGYNNPSYQGNYNLGYGYYNNRRPGAGYGNIYNNGVTPSLVTGYRGYSRR